MSSSVYCPESRHVNLPCLHAVDAGEPLLWLGKGWADFKATWRRSLSYGIALAVLGAVMTYQAIGHPYFIMALMGGFLLVAPILATVFYRLSQNLEARTGELRGNSTAARPWLNAGVGLYGLLLAVVFAIWINLAAIATALLTPRELAMSGEFSLFLLFSADNLFFVIAYLALGALLAASVFSISVVTMPMLIDRRIDLATALATSLAVTRGNFAAMAAWATIIALLTIAGMLSLFIGFAIVFPVLGHASWHAYRSLVEP